MKFYLQIERFPEMRPVPPPLRKKVAALFTRKLRLSTTQSLALGLAICAVGAVWILTVRVVHFWVDSPILTPLAIVAPIAVGIVWVHSLLLRILRPGLTKFITTLHTQGRLHRCMLCDYDLQGSVSVTCPECGAEVILVISDAQTGKDATGPRDESSTL